MTVKVKHTLGFISLNAVYAPTEIYELEEKEILLDKFGCIVGDATIVLKDSINTGRAIFSKRRRMRRKRLSGAGCALS